MIFVDGLGLGKEDRVNNPLVYASTPRLSKFLQGEKLTCDSAGVDAEKVSLLKLDSTLGVQGLPQSASGQAALFTGKNAPRLLGRHLNGFPNRRLKELLKEHNLFNRLQKQGYRVAFLNAYRSEFFYDLREGLQYNHSCSTLMTYYAGVKFRSLEDLQQGQAVYMDITNQVLNSSGYRVELITPEKAADNAAKLAERKEFTLFEYFLTDVIGHQKDPSAAAEKVETLDRFVARVLQNLDLNHTLLLLVSDHGNIEEIDHPRHTYNPVPFIVGGPLEWRYRARECMEDITGVAPFVQEYLKG